MDSIANLMSEMHQQARDALMDLSCPDAYPASRQPHPATRIHASRAQALAMNSELKNQSKQLDGLVETTQDQQGQVTSDIPSSAPSERLPAGAESRGRHCLCCCPVVQVGKSTRKTAAVGGRGARKALQEGSASTAQDMASRVRQLRGPRACPCVSVHPCTDPYPCIARTCVLPASVHAARQHFTQYDVRSRLR